MCPFGFGRGLCDRRPGRGEEINPLPHSPQLYAVLAKIQQPFSFYALGLQKTTGKQFESTYLPLNDSANLAERQARVHSGAMVKSPGVWRFISHWRSAQQ